MTDGDRESSRAHRHHAVWSCRYELRRSFACLWQACVPLVFGYRGKKWDPAPVRPGSHGCMPSHSHTFFLQQHHSTQSVSTLVVVFAQCASFFLVATYSLLVVCDPVVLPILLLRLSALAAVRCAARSSSKAATSHHQPSRTKGDRC